MLKELKIQNLVLIDDLHLEFQKGFSVITGETGAGKSILLSALKIVGGGKAKLMVREGCDFLKIEAVFQFPTGIPLLVKKLQDLEIDIDEEIILERKVYQNGSSRCRLNGSVVKIGSLKEISEFLYDIYGQHDHRFLHDHTNQLILLDKLGGTLSLREQFSEMWKDWKTHLNALETLQQEHRQFQEQQDYFQYQWKELSDANLVAGEDEKIETTLNELKSFEKIQSAHQSSISLLTESNHSIKSHLQVVAKNIKELEKQSRFFEGSLDQLNDILDKVEELSNQFSEYVYPPSLSPSELDNLNSKLAKWQRLQTKYKMDINGLIDLREKRKHQLDNLANFEQDLGFAKEKRDHAFQTLLEIGTSLRAKRHKTSEKFDALVNKNLSQLGMEQAKISSQWVTLKPNPQDIKSVPKSGLDEVGFYLAANQGLPARPLKEVASGGETSRIMLAIKSVFAKWDSIPLYIFDEIDSGIGGLTGNQVGEALKNLSTHHQVLAITHLHQVAAWAESQLNVVKKTKKGQTITAIKVLESSERIVELARMMGDDSSGASLQHAQKILEEKPSH